MQYTARYSSPIGGILLAGDPDALTGLWFDGQKNFPEALARAHREASLPVFDQAVQWLDCYFSGREPDFTPPLRFLTTPFRSAVWRVLLTIPYGHTMTYGEIAAVLSAQSGLTRPSARAVGGAVGHNPVSLIVPCHRVVGPNGSLTGYAGGIDKKIALLTREGVDMTRLFAPNRSTAP